MNNPWRSLAAATRLATQYGQPITAGMIILAGAATNAEFLHQDQETSATVETLGSTGFRFN
jgi:2-oxo-3-hexenedioate decarboxylase